MARQQVFTSNTKLWHAAEGWRVFPAGETDPGGSWSEKEGGAPVGESAAAGALKDLIAANDRLDQMSETLARKDHDLAKTAADCEEAKTALAAMEQRAIAAEKGQTEAEEFARGYMEERDSARAELEAAKAKPGKAATAPDAT